MTILIESLRRGWASRRIRFAPQCLCGHHEWQHMGLGAPACTNLGSCPCRVFRNAKAEAALQKKRLEQRGR